MRKKSYFWILSLILAASLLLRPFEAKADGPDEESPASEEGSTNDEASIDWSRFSYDELLLIREDLNEHIHEMERQYAIENGNRIISLNETEVTLYNRKTFKLEAEVKRVVDDAPEKTTFTWKSSDNSIATVSNTGMVTGMGYGDATITCFATDDEYIYAESVFHVVLPVSGLTVEPSNVTLLITDSKPDEGTTVLNCIINPDNAYIKDVAWLSSNPDVVTVDETGVLHAVSPGQATITVRSEDPESNSKQATCRVSVLQAVSKITLDTSATSININTNTNLRASVFPENASNKSVIWESSDPKIATVSNNGSVRAVAPGTAKIFCTAADGSGVSAECTVHCIQMMTSVRFDVKERTVTLNLNKTTQLKTIIQPENVTDKTLDWSSSDSKIVSVTNDGKIKAISGGSAVITCTAKDGSAKTASIEVYVPSISVSSTEYTVSSKNGLSISFNYYGRWDDFTYTVSPTNLFDSVARKNGNKVSLTISPIRAGTATVVLQDKSDRRSDIKLTVTIAHSACYDTSSYPTGNYEAVLRNPSTFKGKNMSIYGRVLQIGTSWGSTYMRVATRGRYDNVFYVECPSSVAAGIIEDDYITIFGTCSGVETYTTVLGASVTIPSIDAEKIIIGRQ